MAIQISDVSNALQKVIMPYIRDNFPKQTILLDQMKRNAGTTFINDNFYAPVRSSRHGGVTNLANDGNQLVTGKSAISQASVGVKILTGTFDISKLTVEATKTSKGAVENQLTFQAKTLASDFARNVNRQLFSDGVGVVAEVSGSVSATTQTIVYPTSSVDDGRVQDAYGTINGDIAANKYLTPGAIIGIGTAGAATASVTSYAGGTLTTSSVASVANDSIYLVDGDGEGAGTSEIQGLKAALSSSTGTSTYASLARSTYGWTPQVGTTAEALTLSAIEDKYLAAKEYALMGDQYAIFVNKTLYKKYGDLLTAMRRTVNTTDLLGGWTGLEFAAGAGKVGVFLDYDVPDGEVFVVNMDTMTLCQVSDLDWLDDPRLLRRSDYITYQSTMVWFVNMLCLCPAANGHLMQKTG